MPPSTGSAGQEAVELAATAGLILDPWQQAVLDDALAERPDGRWASFEVGLVVPRQNGKGSILEARELAGLFLFGEELILHSAHEFKTAAEAFRRVLSLVQSAPDLERLVKRVRTSHGDEGIELKSGQRLRFVARSTGSGRGFSGDCVILDEAYNLSSEAMAALLPTLSARPNPQLWYTSSAPLPSSVVLRKLCKRGREDGDERLAYNEFCADPSRSSNDPAGWAEANPALGIRISEEFVENEMAALEEIEFRRERLGVWFDDDAEFVIDPDAWKGLVDSRSEMLDPIAFAVDVNPDRTWSAIAAAGVRADGRLHVEVAEHRKGTWWVADRLAELVAQWSPSRVALDGAGPAGSLIPDLKERGVTTDPAGDDVELVLMSGRDMAQACGAFYDAAVDSKSLRHLDQAMLNAAVAGAKRRPLGDAWAWHRKQSSVDISPLVAATLALHAHVTAPNDDEVTPFAVFA